MKESLPTPIPAAGPYSQAIRTGELIFCSGQLPLNPETGEIITEDISKATAQCLENLALVLKAFGSSLENVVKTTVFLTDINSIPAMNEAYSRYFPSPPPARSTVAVHSLPKGVPVEIEAIALCGKKQHG